MFCTEAAATGALWSNRDMEDWRFYHFAPQIKLDWIMKELTCEHFHNSYILISYNHYYYVSCCAFYLHLVSLSWVLLFETKISGPWELLVTWLSSTICVSSCVLSFVSSPLTKHPPSSHLCDLLLLIRNRVWHSYGFWYERISEYIRVKKNDTNEYPYIFVWTFLTRTNIQIYLY